MSASSFLVNEVYPCLQGEGASLGRPSILVRFQICNLRCDWCDTPYTHTLKSDPVDADDLSKGQKFKRHSLEGLCETIRKFESIKHLILTGGEPTMHNLASLMAGLGTDYSAEVESNGTRIPHKDVPGFTFKDYARFQWNISPKGKNAGQILVDDALNHWSELSKQQDNVFFKFVVRKDEASTDMAEALGIKNKFGIAADRIFLMPEGTSVESQLNNDWLHDLCLANGFRYTPRLHILLFGSKRGT